MIDFKLRHRIISNINDINVVGIRGFSQKILPKILIPHPSKGQFFIKTLYGYFMKIDPTKDNGIERSLYYTGTYEKGSLDLIQNVLKEGDVFVDVGANIGMMTVFASKVVGNKGKVVAFEPNPITRDILKENIKKNNLSNVIISEYAIGATNEDAVIYDRWDANRGCASLIKPDFETDSYDIKVTTLSNFLDDGINPNMIKIDVEGYELEVLKGVLDIIQSKDAPMLMVEYSDMRVNKVNGNTFEIYDLIKESNNYKFYKHKGTKSRVSKLIEIKDHGDLPKHDNIYCFLPRHIDSMDKKMFE